MRKLHHKTNRHINLVYLKFFDVEKAIQIDKDESYVRLWFNKEYFNFIDASFLIHSQFIRRYLLSIHINWTNTIYGWRYEHCEDFWVWYNIKGNFKP